MEGEGEGRRRSRTLSAAEEEESEGGGRKSLCFGAYFGYRRCRRCLVRPRPSLAWGPRSFIPRWKSGRRRAIRTSPASGAGGAERQTEMELGGRHRESRTSATGYQERWVGGGAHCHCPNSSRLGYANCVSDTMKFVPCLSLSNEKRLWPSRNRLIFPVEKGQK